MEEKAGMISVGPAEWSGISNEAGGSNFLTPQQWGMIAFLVSEVAFFGTLIAVYLHFLGQDETGPSPGVLSLPLVIGTTICLLSSSLTIHRAEKTFHSGSETGFLGWWSATILLGIIFLAGTAYEWRSLIHEHDLTISRNLFGTTYYTLVGFHALHVTVGVIVMVTVLVVHRSWFENRDTVHGSGATENGPRRGAGVQLVSWYWHFVDAVWIMVFSVVYLFGR